MRKSFPLGAIVGAVILPVGAEPAGPTKPPVEFVGHTYTHTWKEGAVAGASFDFTYISDDTLRWTGVAGPYKDNSAEEKYKHVQLGPSLHQIAFKEYGKPAKGLPTLFFVVFTYDFEKKVIHGVVNDDARILVLEGTFVEKDAPAK